MKDPHKKRKKAAALGAPSLDPAQEPAFTAFKQEVEQALKAGQDLAALAELLDSGNATRLTDSLVLATLGSISHPAVPPLLVARFGSHPDKHLRKALKRIVHRLKTQGVPVADDIWPRQEKPESEAGGPAGLGAFITPVFDKGEQFIILEARRDFPWGNFLVARLDEDSLLECHVLSLKRKHREQVWADLKKDGLEEWVAAPLTYALGALEKAFHGSPESNAARAFRPVMLTLRSGESLPAEAFEVRTLLPVLEEVEKPELLEKSRHLPGDPRFFPWMPTPDKMTPWLVKFQEIQESPFYLSKEQKLERMEDMINKAVLDFFPLQERPLWGRRLLRMAYYLLLEGHMEVSRVAQAAGEDLLDRPYSALAEENLFLKGMVSLSLVTARKMLDEARTPTSASPVLTPSEPLIIKG